MSNSSSLLGLVLSLNPENLRHLTCPVVTIIVFLLLHFESPCSSMEFFHSNIDSLTEYSYCIVHIPVLGGFKLH